MDQRLSVGLLHDGTASKGGEKLARPLAISAMAGGTGIVIDQRACLKMRIVVLQSHGFCRVALNAFQVCGDRLQILVLHRRRRVFDHFRHRTGRNRMTIGAGFQICGDFIVRPAANPRVGIAADVGRIPALQRRAGESTLGLVSAENALRRVAGRAMARPLNKVGAPVPLGRLLAVRFERVFREVDRLPTKHG